MTSTILKDFLEKNTASQVQSKNPRKSNPVKRKTQYQEQKEMNIKLNAELNKILAPIAQDLLTSVIKLKNKQGKITVKSNFDNKKYGIEIKIRKYNK